MRSNTSKHVLRDETFNLANIANYNNCVWKHLLDYMIAESKYSTDGSTILRIEYDGQRQDLFTVEDNSIALLHEAIVNIFDIDETSDHKNHNIYADTILIGSREYKLPYNIILRDLISSFALCTHLIKDQKFNSPIKQDKALNDKMRDIKLLLSNEDKTPALEQMSSFFNDLSNSLFEHPISFTLDDFDTKAILGMNILE